MDVYFLLQGMPDILRSPNTSIQKDQALFTLQDIFGKEIVIVFRDPKRNDDLLVRADLRNMAINAATETRNNIVKISDTDRKEETTTNSQLIYCLWPVMMKTISSWEKIDLYIQTSDAIAQIESALSDNDIQSFVQNKIGKFGEWSDASLNHLYGDTVLLKDFLGLDKTPSILADIDGLFIRPDVPALRDEKRMDSIRIDKELNNPLAKSYRSLMLSPGSYIFPIYTKNADGSTHSQLLVHAQTIVGG